MKRIVTVVGARPQFIKAAAVNRAMSRRGGTEIAHFLLHTGQHYDDNMSSVFFRELDLPAADANLGIGGGTHGAMTGAMLEGIEKVLLERKPDWLLIYGDTDSTLAGALAAAKLHIPVAHVEAGLRSFNRRMPEEINRVLADHVSTLLLCPTVTAVENLRAEGVRSGVHLVGDVMYDASLFYRDRAAEASMLGELGLKAGQYFLATCHRAENTDDPRRLGGLFEGLTRVSKLWPVILPVHPRTSKMLKEHGLHVPGGIRLIPPIGYLQMADLERHARALLTDSGGVQKEAYFYGVPCITLRTETEWVETVAAGWNTVVDCDPDRIEAAAGSADEVRTRPRPSLYGDGDASEKIVELLLA
jgi:UDP-GlcNAc3NAcA epimerase